MRTTVRRLRRSSRRSASQPTSSSSLGLRSRWPVDAAVEQLERCRQMLRTQPRDAQLRADAAEEQPQRVVHDRCPPTRASSGCSMSRGLQLPLDEPQRGAGLERLQLGHRVRLLARQPREHLTVPQPRGPLPGRQRALDPRPGAPAVRRRERQCRRRVAARERGECLQPLAFVVAGNACNGGAARPRGRRRPGRARPRPRTERRRARARRRRSRAGSARAARRRARAPPRRGSGRAPPAAGGRRAARPA